MSKDKLKHAAKEILAAASIRINNGHPWDIQIHNSSLYKRVLRQGSIGLGEAYMDGWWYCERLDEFFYRYLRMVDSSKIESVVKRNRELLIKAVLFNKISIPIERILNMQSKGRAFEIGGKHYDLGNDLFENMLDKLLVYSCAYWKDAKTLDEAQENKLELVCQKIGLKPGDSVLDIGCGWGGFAKYAAEKYKARVVGVTVSKEQVDFANKLCKNLPVEIRLQDYRNINEKFDYIVSLGMFEHVGYKNYSSYMKVAHRSLEENGLFLLHTIGNNQSITSIDPWINKYIFPNAILPSIEQIGKSIGSLFIMEDWHNFGSDYDKTIMAWFSNFNKNWGKIKSNYDERFYRMWKYYLLLTSALFRSRKIQLWQIVLSKKGIQGGYESIR